MARPKQVYELCRDKTVADAEAMDDQTRIKGHPWGCLGGHISIRILEGMWARETTPAEYERLVSAISGRTLEAGDLERDPYAALPVDPAFAIEGDLTIANISVHQRRSPDTVRKALSKLEEYGFVRRLAYKATKPQP